MPDRHFFGVVLKFASDVPVPDDEEYPADPLDEFQEQLIEELVTLELDGHGIIDPEVILEADEVTVTVNITVDDNSVANARSLAMDALNISLDTVKHQNPGWDIHLSEVRHLDYIKMFDD